MATVPSSETPSDRLKFYDVNDLRQMFHVGRNKARLMMDALPSIRVGSKDYVTESALNAHIAKHGGILVKWPSRIVRPLIARGLLVALFDVVLDTEHHTIFRIV